MRIVPRFAVVTGDVENVEIEVSALLFLEVHVASLPSILKGEGLLVGEVHWLGLSLQEDGCWLFLGQVKGLNVHTTTA